MANAYVIVGGSLAGATAAVTLREEGADRSVTLIGAEREPPYERPLLSKGYLRGDVSYVSQTSNQVDDAHAWSQARSGPTQFVHSGEVCGQERRFPPDRPCTGAFHSETHAAI